MWLRRPVTLAMEVALDLVGQHLKSTEGRIQVIAERQDEIVASNSTLPFRRDHRNVAGVCAATNNDDVARFQKRISPSGQCRCLDANKSFFGDSPSLHIGCSDNGQASGVLLRWLSQTVAN